MNGSGILLLRSPGLTHTAAFSRRVTGSGLRTVEIAGPLCHMALASSKRLDWAPSYGDIKTPRGKDFVDTVSPVTSTMPDIDSVFNRD